LGIPIAQIVDNLRIQEEYNGFVDDNCVTKPEISIYNLKKIIKEKNREDRLSPMKRYIFSDYDIPVRVDIVGIDFMTGRSKYIKSREPISIHPVISSKGATRKKGNENWLVSGKPKRRDSVFQ